MADEVVTYPKQKQTEIPSSVSSHKVKKLYDESKPMILQRDQTISHREAPSNNNRDITYATLLACDGTTLRHRFPKPSEEIKHGSSLNMTKDSKGASTRKASTLENDSTKIRSFDAECKITPASRPLSNERCVMYATLVADDGTTLCCSHRHPKPSEDIKRGSSLNMTKDSKGTSENDTTEIRSFDAECKIIPTSRPLSNERCVMYATLVADDGTTLCCSHRHPKPSEDITCGSSLNMTKDSKGASENDTTKIRSFDAECKIIPTSRPLSNGLRKRASSLEDKVISPTLGNNKALWNSSEGFRW